MAERQVEMPTLPPGIREGMIQQNTGKGSGKERGKEQKLSSSDGLRQLLKANEYIQKKGKYEATFTGKVTELTDKFVSYMNRQFFYDIPEFYPFRKKVIIYKQTSLFFMCFDMFIVFGSFLLCMNYVAETYDSSYEGQLYYGWTETIFTAVFIVDFLFSWYIFEGRTINYFTRFHTIIDFLTIVPVLTSYGTPDKGTNVFQIFRFLRILRLLRILKAFKEIYGFDELNRQIAQLSLTLVSLIFVAAGVVEMLENEVKQEMYYDCLYSTKETNFEPSCSPDAPYSELASCDCHDFEYRCTSVYARSDAKGEPSQVRCRQYTFFECIYFILVTLSTVGYGDISPSHGLSRLATVLILVAIVVLLPIQISKLSDLLALKSPYRASYIPAKKRSHIMVCGFVNNKEKLENLYRELFNEGRCTEFGPDFQVLILGRNEPKEEVIIFLISKTVDGRMVYRIGDVLSSDDMSRVSCEMALAVFFLCDPSLTGKKAMHADIEVVLETIAVESINGDIETLSQMILHENRDLIFDTDVDVILTFQDYKATLMARNAMCPGMATLLEGLITSSTILATKKSTNEKLFCTWQLEYFASCDKEIYLFKLDHSLLARLSYKWPLIVEGLYLQYGYICLGVCDEDACSMVLNPTFYEINTEGGAEEFFKIFTHGILIADTQVAANTVTTLSEEVGEISDMIEKMFEAEVQIPCCRVEDNETNEEEEEDFMDAFNTADNSVVKLHSGMDNEIAELGILYRREKTNSAFLRKFYDNSPTYERYVRDRSSLKARNTNYLETVEKVGEVAPGTRGHVVIIGATVELPHVLRECRRPLITKDRRRKIIIFAPDDPSTVSKVYIKEHVEDVIWVRGSSIALEEPHKLSHKLQLESAFSVCIMSADLFGTDHEDDTEDTINTDHGDLVLFYLQLQNNLPNTVFFSCYFENTHKLTLLDMKISDYVRKHRMLQVEKDALDAIAEDESDNRSFVLRKGGFILDDGTIAPYANDLDNRAGKQTKSKYNFHSSKKENQDIEHDSHLTQRLKENSSEQFWDFRRSPSSLSIVASGKAFASSSFDALLVQCFLSKVSAKFFECLTQGQKYQTIFQIKIPPAFVGRPFKDFFRVMMSRNILVLSLYRAPSDTNEAQFPYVVTGPSELYWTDKEYGKISKEARKAILHLEDQAFVFTNPDLLAYVLNDLESELERKYNGSGKSHIKPHKRNSSPLGDDSNSSSSSSSSKGKEKAIITSISPTQERSDIASASKTLGGGTASTDGGKEVNALLNKISDFEDSLNLDGAVVHKSNKTQNNLDLQEIPRIPKPAYSTVPSDEIVVAAQGNGGGAKQAQVEVEKEDFL